MDEPLTSSPLSDKALEHHAIFQVPIIVVPGLNHNAVRMQLETLLMQPGIRPDMVTVSFFYIFAKKDFGLRLWTRQIVSLHHTILYVKCKCIRFETRYIVAQTFII